MGKKAKEIPVILHFESSGEDIVKKILGHQCEWIVRELQGYPAGQRERIYNYLVGMD